MIIDPLQYTELIEEVRTLKALNNALTFENESLRKELLVQKQSKDIIELQYFQFKQKMQFQHQQLLKSCTNQIALITNQLTTKKQQQTLYLQKKIAQLQKTSYQKFKALEIQFKDFRLKSHLHDQFVNKLLKLYPENHTPGLPELYNWIKKAVTKDKTIKQQNHFGVSQKENKKILTKTLQKDKSKIKILDTTK